MIKLMVKLGDIALLGVLFPVLLFGLAMYEAYAYVCVAHWFLFTQPYVPRNKLSRYLEFDDIVYMHLSDEWRKQYLENWEWRRGQVEIREHKRNYPSTRRRIKEKLAAGAYAKKSVE